LEQVSAFIGIRKGALQHGNPIVCSCSSPFFGSHEGELPEANRDQKKKKQDPPRAPWQPNMTSFAYASL
jgi:hypothetical protein